MLIRKMFGRKSFVFCWLIEMFGPHYLPSPHSGESERVCVSVRVCMRDGVCMVEREREREREGEGEMMHKEGGKGNFSAEKVGRGCFLRSQTPTSVQKARERKREREKERKREKNLASKVLWEKE